MCVNVGAVVVEEEAQTGARANVLAAAWAAAEVPTYLIALKIMSY